MITVKNDNDSGMMQSDRGEGHKERRKTKLVGLCMIFSLLLFFGSTMYKQSVNVEDRNEQADFLAMRNAELTARLWIKNGQINGGE